MKLSSQIRGYLSYCALQKHLGSYQCSIYKTWLDTKLLTVWFVFQLKLTRDSFESTIPVPFCAFSCIISFNTLQVVDHIILYPMIISTPCNQMHNFGIEVHTSSYAPKFTAFLQCFVKRADGGSTPDCNCCNVCNPKVHIRAAVKWRVTFGQHSHLLTAFMPLQKLILMWSSCYQSVSLTEFQLCM